LAKEKVKYKIFDMVKGQITLTFCFIKIKKKIYF